MNQAEINDKLKDLVGDDEEDEDVDDMLNDLMNDIKKDKTKKIEQKGNVNVNVPQTQKAKVKEEDDIAKMLADLGWKAVCKRNIAWYRNLYELLINIFWNLNITIKYTNILYLLK